MANLSNALTPIQRIKQDEEEGKCISNKQDKSPEGDPNEMEMYCLPDLGEHLYDGYFEFSVR